MTRSRWLRAVALAVALASASRGSAQEPPPGTGMHYHLGIDLGVTLGAGATVLTLELLTPVLGSHCRWCDRHADGSDALNGFDASVRRALRWKDVKTADTLSSIFSFGLAPAAGIGVAAIITAYEHRMAELPADILVVSESAMITLVLTDLTKFGVARERPDVHARTPEQRAAQRKDGDNLSFFSGHTSLAFALAVSAGTIASMRHHKLAPVMWASGLALASLSAYLRIAADRHYATDVLMGMVVGSAVGFSVPYFFHRETSKTPSNDPAMPHAMLSALPLPGGSALNLAGTF
jgi:PAP2 superfamily protein